MTISISWKDNGDLAISCGGDEIVIPKASLQKKVEGDGALAVTISTQSESDKSKDSLPHLTVGSGGYVALDHMVISPDYRWVDNLQDMEKVIIGAIHDNSSNLCVGWKSREAIPIDYVRSLLKAESRPMEISLLPASSKSQLI